MKSFPLKFLICLILGFSLNFSAQSQCGSCVLNTCPSNEGDLANGGTFCTSGTCNVSTGGNNSATLNGKVIWCSGILNLTGSPGDIFVNDTILILGGTI
ncbi:MAG TPA: hypothetical protein DCS15_10390 [Flavobacteriales bacterium]|nr:hypothetical protein [Flavobacteriales bacterium]